MTLSEAFINTLGLMVTIVATFMILAAYYYYVDKDGRK